MTEGYTYEPVGHTRAMLDGAQGPDDFAHLDESTVIGHGKAVFRAVGAAVLNWGVQRGIGFAVTPGKAAEQGLTITVRIRFNARPVRALGLAGHARVVWVEENDRVIGFAYGTLPGHPESGEEAFVVTIDDDDVVRFRVFAYSRQSWLILRAFPFVGKALQSVATRGYLRAARTIAKQIR